VAPQPSDDYVKWERWAYGQIYGPGSWDRDKGIERKEGTYPGFQEYYNLFKLDLNNRKRLGRYKRTKDSKPCKIVKFSTSTERMLIKL
jgi:hypothetical protein